MKKIVILPPGISQKIAAGEVIERPFSAVKELVENSLDSGASEINVELLHGGKVMIKVSDNGCGMSREDALVCFERYSTSKLSREEDLLAISTLGFRGEALPSISAVSRIILRTSDGTEERGSQIEREGEKLIHVSDIAFPKGTSVEVRDLFFNLPARKKFLRSERSELSLIVKYLTSVALVYPEIRFSLSHGKRTVFSFPHVRSLKERLFQVYGKSLLERLMEVNSRENERQLRGYATSPPSGRSDRSRQLFFVNKRPVREKTLLGALNKVYKGFLEKDQYAEAFLFLTCPYAEVDVNVHPAKAEIRFKDASPIYQLVVRSIEQAILKERGIKEIYPSGEERKREFRIEEKMPRVASRTPEETEIQEPGLFPPRTEEERFYPHVLGQFLDSYIVASSEEGILIIDQHNAHERVLYERYLQTDQMKKWPRKLALLPILFELSPSQVLSFEGNQGLLEETGFRVEAMGGKSYVLKEYPDIFKEEEAEGVFIFLLEEMKEEKIKDKRQRLLATLACKTAIKAGQTLSLEKMRFLVEELFKTKNSSLCPHGRPIVVKVDRKQIERGLKRS
jgi:DNA mismatch repair protein MutL